MKWIFSFLQGSKTLFFFRRKGGKNKSGVASVLRRRNSIINRFLILLFLHEVRKLKIRGQALALRKSFREKLLWCQFLMEWFNYERSCCSAFQLRNSIFIINWAGLVYWKKDRGTPSREVEMLFFLRLPELFRRI